MKDQYRIKETDEYTKVLSNKTRNYFKRNLKSNFAKKKLLERGLFCRRNWSKYSYLRTLFK